MSNLVVGKKYLLTHENGSRGEIVATTGTGALCNVPLILGKSYGELICNGWIVTPVYPEGTIAKIHTKDDESDVFLAEHIEGAWESTSGGGNIEIWEDSEVTVVEIIRKGKTS